MQWNAMECNGTECNAKSTSTLTSTHQHQNQLITWKIMSLKVNGPLGGKRGGAKQT